MQGTAFLRIWGLALLALAILSACYCESQPTRAADLSAPAGSFSAARAEAVLARVLGPERPHPVSSPENAAVRARILTEFTRIGIPARTWRSFACNPWRHLAYIACASVTDIIADAVPGRGRAIVLMAHYDSVPAGPGASDDESGVATVLETVRALRAGPGNSRHPVMALITDGEEPGLLGAQAFLQNPALKDRVGAVVNVEARGTRGQSHLFQTSSGDGPLIALYAKSVPVFATSSLYAEIYRFLPNDTDLTLFIRDGFPSYNFAFVDNVHAYHSPRDTRANLAPASLQMHGDNLLGMARGLETTEFAALKGGNDIYLSIFGAVLPRLPASWALPAALLAFLAFVLAARAARCFERAGICEAIAAALMPPVLLVIAAVSGWLLALIAQTLSGHADPTYASPLWMRVGLGFALWAATLLAARMAKPENAAASAWLWMSGFGIAAAAFLPGISPYFVFPALAAALILLPTARLGWSGPIGYVALLAAALPALIIWFALVATGETLMGLSLHPLFTVPAAFGLMTLAPLLAPGRDARTASRISLAASATAALLCAVTAGLVPTYSTASPQRVNLIYLEGESAQARWIADSSWKTAKTERIPEDLMRAGHFVYDPDAWGSTGLGDGYAADAGHAQFALPQAQVTSDRVVNGMRTVTLALHGSPDADGMLLRIPRAAGLAALDLRGQHLTGQGWSGQSMLSCASRDCRDLAVTLTLGSHTAVALPFAELRYGLPASGARLQAARPATAMASQSGDETILTNMLTLGAR